MSETVTAPREDERIVRVGIVARILQRPDIGAFLGAVGVFVLFSITASDVSWATDLGIWSTWLNTGAYVGIVAVPVALLMIGGEFDLSAGVMIGSSGLLLGILTTRADWNIWPAIAVVLLFGLAVGLANGVTVVRTGLPSFIVTLGTFFVLQGVNLAVTKILIGKVSVTGLQDAAGYYDGKQVFGSFVDIDMSWVPWLEPDDAKTTLTLFAATFWWLGVTAVATWVLTRTRAGNWVFAVGGAQTSARQAGVPVTRTKVGLFVTTAVAGWLVGMLQLFKTTTVQSTTGVGQEFIFIICAVVGGCLLTGGYGSAVGAALGALIYGMVQQGIPQAGWDNDWLYAFLGVMLLGAVLVNNWVKTRAETMR